MKKSPRTAAEARFKDKTGLVAAVRKLATDDLWLDKVNEDKGLERVSNRKLLHLHDVLSEIKEKHGTRDGLIAAILEAEKRDKDDGYRTRLAAWPSPRLLSHYRSRAKKLQ